MSLLSSTQGKGRRKPAKLVPQVAPLKHKPFTMKWVMEIHVKRCRGLPGEVV